MKPSHLARLLVLFVLLILAAFAIAAPPQTINYQGYLRNTDGTPVSTATSVRFSLYSSNPSRNNPVWQETKSVTPANGIYSTQLGSATPITAPFDVPYWLGVKVAGDSEMALQALSSSPYAYRATVADSVPGNSIGTGAIADSSVTTNKIATGAVTDAQISGTISAAKLDLSSVQKKYAKTAVVAQSGGDYTNPVAAMTGLASWCGAPSAGNPCLLKIMPGVYDLGTSTLYMQPYVDIEGSGVITTSITSAVGNAGLPTAGVVNGASNAEIRQLSIKNVGGSGLVAAVVNSGASPKMTYVNASASGGSGSFGVYNDSSSPNMHNVTAITSGGTDNNYGIRNSSSNPTMTHVTATASGGAKSYGVFNSQSNPRMTSVNATASGGSTENYGVYNVSSLQLTMNDVKATASGGPNCYGLWNQQSIPGMNNVTATASGTTNSFGIYNIESAPSMVDVIASGASGTGSNYGLYNSAASGSYTMNIDRSTFIGSTNSILNDPHFTLRIGASKLVGTVNDQGTFVYLNSYSDTATLGTITTANLTDASVTTAKIADASVTAAKLDTAYVKLSGDTMTGSLNISSGHLALPATSTTGGIIYSAGNPLIHRFGNNNFFAGINTGNLTMTGIGYNTAIGSNALSLNTTGNNNTASGVFALYSNTTGYQNTANGMSALKINTTGYQNTANGLNALYANTTGAQNTASGVSTLTSNTEGSGNTALGYNAGSNQTIGNNNIYIGSNVLGVEGESDVTRIGNGQTQTYIAGEVNADRIVATVATGTSPLQVNSTTQVNNLNAEMVGGMTLSSLDSRYAITRTQVPTAEQIATLRWDLAKQGNEFGCGGDPRGIAFDGAYLWVANYTANTVSRVRPGDGVKVDSFPVGTNPVSVAFDGSDIWVVNTGGNNVSRLHSSDGSGVATYDMGAGAVPMGIAFDGSAMWVTNSGTSTVTRINAATGTMTPFMTSSAPYGVVFDGEKIWVACSGFNNVLSYRISDGFNSATISVGASPRWLAFDGTYIWVTNNSDGTVTRFQASDGSNATSFSVGSFPTGIAFDGRSVWVAVSGTSGIVKLRAADGLNQGTYLVNGTPRRLVFDGSSIWAAVGGLDKLVKLVDAGVAPVPLGVGAGGLADNAVNTGKLMDSSVTSAKIADASVTAAKLADGAVTTAKIADGAVTAAKLDTQYAPASAIAPPVQYPRTNTITTVDSGGNVGWHSSITIGSDGLPMVSYKDDVNADLKVAKCGNSACSSGNSITTVDSGGNVGSFTSITIGSDGLPVISYYDQANGDLKVAKCGNAACSSGNSITTIDSNGSVGWYTSITIGSDGLPVVSYRDDTNADLKVAKCGNSACSSGNSITTVDSGGNVGSYTSITIGSDGLPVISYFDATNGDLKVAKCGNAACSNGNSITTIDSPGNVGWYSSITIGSDGLPVVSYRDEINGDLKVAKCGNAACSSGNSITTVDSGGGRYSSITIGSDGLPVISYMDNTNGYYLKVAKCANTACSSGNTITTVDSTGDVAYYTSITIGSDGLPVISYLDFTNRALKVAKCANQFCLNNWSRR